MGIFYGHTSPHEGHIFNPLGDLVGTEVVEKVGPEVAPVKIKG